jgi:hypothetical protein
VTSARHTRPRWFGLAPVLHPRCWPRWVRRLFVLTLPIALPLWMVAALLLAVLSCLGEIAQPLHRFWSAPQRYRYSYSYYSYHPDLKPNPAEIREVPIGEPSTVAPDLALRMQAELFLADGQYGTASRAWGAAPTA